MMNYLDKILQTKKEVTQQAEVNNECAQPKPLPRGGPAPYTLKN